jgi:hypothetical protein
MQINFLGAGLEQDDSEDAVAPELRDGAHMGVELAEPPHTGVVAAELGHHQRLPHRPA